MPDKRIFLVEDNSNLGFTISDGLQLAGYQVDLFNDGVTAASHFNPENYDLCLLDIMLPKMDGFTLAEIIRNKNSQVPIIFLTARSMEEDRLKGFKIGGDDYITKPFSMKELVCRIEVFIKRSRSTSHSNESGIVLGQYLFDPGKLLLSHPQETVTLTTREADLLAFLWSGQNTVIKREEILQEVWGDDDYFKGRSLDVFISRLRKYLQYDPQLEIRNYHGVGFSLML